MRWDSLSSPNKRSDLSQNLQKIEKNNRLNTYLARITGKIDKIF
ncbi:hypothetical protein appser2_14990 [Actinobacillus pleuropneumoniae serovar 2 str. S1536]|nr:hypothetical protein appser2_14990 [Actinobacillus pleuropneumoniae serovar 2 str. S1536]